MSNYFIFISCRGSENARSYFKTPTYICNKINSSIQGFGYHNTYLADKQIIPTARQRTTFCLAGLEVPTRFFLTIFLPRGKAQLF